MCKLEYLSHILHKSSTQICTICVREGCRKKNEGKNEGKRARGQEGTRARGQEGKRARGQKPQTTNFPLFAPVSKPFMWDVNLHISEVLIWTGLSTAFGG